MTESGHGVQVVTVTENHSYYLDVDALKEILTKEEVKDLPVVVVSMAGAYRGGKSFMLNFFLRYLMAPVSARADGTWLGDPSQPLDGFSWRGGAKPNTTGILMWSEPILTSLSSGEKVVVLLMDTQGTFDNKSTVKDCSTIFALSTLVSSVQVYNLPGGSIQEDDLQHLQLFTEYGKMINDQQSGNKAFQVLEFLVRDWPNSFEFAYGSLGGQTYLDDILKVNPNTPKELSELRSHIRASFETVSCFLMPHPGLAVRSPAFKGKLSELEGDFVDYVKELTSSIFGPEKLKVKKINGQTVKAQELFTYFQSYMSIFNSNTIPTPTSIMRATAQANLLLAMNSARELYEAGMDEACGEAAPSVPADELKTIHQRMADTATGSFKATKKMGSKEEADQYLKKLTQHIESRLPQYMSLNMGKVRKAISDAREVYEKTVASISGDKPLCVHALDLQAVHKQAVDAAVELFDSRRRSTGKDQERDAFIKTFDQRYRVLRLTNEQNNKNMLTELRMEYWQYMEQQTIQSPPLSSSEFLREHEKALATALEEFKNRRNRPSVYTEDVYRSNLIQAIETTFESLKMLNSSKNKEAIKAGVAAYKQHMTSVQPAKNKCLHPEDLQREHESAKCRALLAFRPRKSCSAGFDPTDEDETTLLGIIEQEYSEAKSSNDSANQIAVQTAFNAYKELMDELCRPTLWWLLIVPIFVYFTNKSKYHEECKAQALNVFYSQRQGGNYHENDVYRRNLEQMIEEGLKDYP